MKTMMKKLGFAAIALCLTLAACAATEDNDRPVSYNELPKETQEFISTHFPSVKMAYADVDWEGYDVILSDGTDLEFSRNGQWKEIQVRQSNFPESIMKLLPAALTDYLNQNYPGKTIREITKKRNGYEVELDGLDLEFLFDSNGNFRRIDD